MGERIGAYELLMELAAGGMATVHLARGALAGDASPRLVAIKRPHRHLVTEKVFVAMLIDEARLARAIEHPNVVKVRELGFVTTNPEEPFLVLDFVEGGSLSDLRKALAAEGRAFRPRVALRIALDALAGLHAAHEWKDEDGVPLGIVHRDVSPHNVLVGTDGVSRLTDFGIAKAEDRVQITRTNEVKGKLAYFAPERVDHRRMCTVQSDVFSMAAVLWECLAGRRLFRGDEALDTLDMVMRMPIPTLAALGVSLPNAVDGVIAQALSRDLELRYKTAAEFSAALTEAAEGEIADAPEVAELVYVVLGSRVRQLREKLSVLVGPESEAALIQASGLPPDEPLTEAGLPLPRASQEPGAKRTLDAISVAAPSQRYADLPIPPPLAPPAIASIAPAAAPGPASTPQARALAVVAVGSALLAIGFYVAIVAGSPAPEKRASAPPSTDVAVADADAGGSPAGPLASDSAVSPADKRDKSPAARAAASPFGARPPPGSVRDGFTKLR